MRKHAFLMTTYCYPNLINRMIDKYSPHFDFYIHIDKKSVLTTEDIHQHENVTVIKELSVNWGGANHLAAFLHLMELARKNEGKYDYYHLLTGQDCVVVKPEMFDKLTNGQHSYITFDYATKVWSKEAVRLRYNRYRFPDLFNFKNMRHFFWERWISKFLCKVGIRPRAFGSDLFGGSTYCSLTDEAVSYILQNGKPLYNRLKYTLIPEEVYFQTILVNSPLRNKLENTDLRFIDWTEGGTGPRCLNEKDFGQITNGKYLFARKIDPVKSATLLELLDDCSYYK